MGSVGSQPGFSSFTKGLFVTMERFKLAETRIIVALVINFMVFNSDALSYEGKTITASLYVNGKI